MTTTLRPTEPERPLTGGGRTRHYAICVNGTPVGGVRFTLPAGERTGRIEELEVRADARRRGRGTTALLAGEEILRSWGCRRAEAVIPAEAEDALRLAAELGYWPLARRMAKHLTGGGAEAAATPLPEGCVLRPIGAAEFPDWYADRSRRYAEELQRSGLGADEARRRSETLMAAYFAGGADTPGTVLSRLTVDGEPGGELWIRLDHTRHPDGRRLAWITYVEVAEGLRGRGLGRALLLQAEREVLAAGGRDLGLNVAEENAAARGLYRTLGYADYAISVGKPL
ncbi:GNAT family N-acetyltransferase [Phaeacidiphilus oryzae]|uniref:GNAT family N-acetyltransferase n=1 Tax=Phaeacidiphilus oryzae TaxID=348818 RepID=UPI00056D4D32|nr:GNAT family N-acetyltransferase [Phaeacidiphilus oryzae]